MLWVLALRPFRPTWIRRARSIPPNLLRSLSIALARARADAANVVFVVAVVGAIVVAVYYAPLWQFASMMLFVGRIHTKCAA